MQPKPSDESPQGKQWGYEVKYDGFRAVLDWGINDVFLISRNGKDLTNNFPEIISYCKQNQGKISSHLPLKIDGEIAILNTKLQANFSLLQQRGRLKSNDKIKQAALDRPAHLLGFDLLDLNGKTLTKETYQTRKKELKNLFDGLGVEGELYFNERLGFISSYSNESDLWKQIVEHHGEGIVAKRMDSKYTLGKVHGDWFKIKNWRTITGVLTTYNKENGYFEVASYHNHLLEPLGKFKHGLEGEHLTILKKFISSKGTKVGDVYQLPPAICVDVNCLDVKDGELREPVFKEFRLDLTPEQCTYNEVRSALAMFPDTVDLSKQDKVFWEEKGLTKGDLLLYLREITPYMLPFLTNKALTVIRCPDGVDEESFFQKHLPSYAPDFVAGLKADEETLLHCGSVDALIWFGNHGALEYHVPFQFMGENKPNEIVFDLDPPSIEEFPVSIYAAQLLKELLDQFQLKSFVKTSGNKGLQVYIPVTKGSITYKDTATFTQTIAYLLEKKHPDLFTTERFKKNRHNRLYIDYVQHGKDKTLIAPYSPRINKQATVSTPLFWKEVNDSLSPINFTIETVVDRVKQLGCPFASYQETRRTQDLQLVKEFVDDN
ncbi:DNA ligase D [Aquibacillus saliphilus]|uniref:DNA ligase D n=1 Tax=Aquibacillus saliphilus TaxID=1909422 RepID=UPI001CF0384D|nr:DNA ligase D [Aquibacillus saliphilus]